MKRTFIFLGILGTAITVRAQKSDLFNPRQHLERKTTQQFWVRPPDTRLQTLKKGKPIARQSYTYLASGDKLFQLPVDNMPCIVPDMDLFRQMPNAALIGGISGTGTIPNPAPLLRIK